VPLHSVMNLALLKNDERRRSGGRGVSSAYPSVTAENEFLGGREGHKQEEEVARSRSASGEVTEKGEGGERLVLKGAMCKGRRAEERSGLMV